MRAFADLCLLFLTYARFLLTYVRVYWFVCEFAELCARLLTYVRVCWFVCAFADLCARLLVYARVC